MPSDLVYAIDFGTSNSLLGAADATGVRPLVPLDEDAPDPAVLRSLMYFEPRQPPVFGLQAVRNYTENSMSGRFLRSFKRFLPMKSFESTLIDGRLWTLEEMIARFLREMRERANAHYSQDVDRVIMGRPAAFSEDADADALAQTRLEKAARLAGFRHLEFLPEPVAAAYRFRHEMRKEEIVLVADFGGGTSDYTVLKLSQKEFLPSDVLAVGGAPVAGDALDASLMKNHVAKNFGAEVAYKVPFGSNILTMPKGIISYLNSTAHINFLNSRENREFLQRVQEWALKDDDRRVMDQLAVLLENQLGFSIFEAIEAAKRQLSDQEKTEIVFKYPGIKVQEPVSRADFRRDSEEEIAKIFGALDETLKRAGVEASQVDRICCTGGTAKALVVKEQLSKRFEASRLENFRNFTSIVEGLGERARQVAAT
jgi:hypothetical chaperone protein